MSVGMVMLLALFSALWIFGLIDQLDSDTSTKHYLAISLAVIALGVFRFTRRRKD